MRGERIQISLKEAIIGLPGRLIMVERLFLAVPRGCLQFVIVVFPDHTHLLFLNAGLVVFFRRSGSVLVRHHMAL